MIKRISAVFVVLLMLCGALSGAAFAYEYYDPNLPQPDNFTVWNTADPWNGNPGFPQDVPAASFVSIPLIQTEPRGFTSLRGAVPDALRVGAACYDGGTLCYQWYKSFSGSYNDMSPIDGACASAYTPEQLLGTVYYCVGVTNAFGVSRSDTVYSSLVPVTYSGIQIVNVPAKRSYALGDSVNLSGLNVKVCDNLGNVWNSQNGSGLNVYPSVFQSAGQVAVEVSYAGSSDVFYVNVTGSTGGNGGKTTTVDANGNIVETDGSHTHSFGEWEVIKPATCVTTGTQTRTCACGETETEEIARTEHTWDDGVITKEATATANGAKLYTCTICKANKSEIIPAGSVSKEVEEQAASLNINGGDPEAPGSTYNSSPAAEVSAPTPSPTPTSAPVPSPETQTVAPANAGANGMNSVASGTVGNTDSGTGWWLIPVSALLLVGTGTGAYYVMRKKGSGSSDV